MGCCCAKLSAEDAQELGMKCVGVEDYLGAVKIFSRGIRADPQYAALYLKRGGCYLRMHRLTDALADFNQCLTLSPDMAGARVGRSGVYIRQGAFEMAAHDCMAVLRRNPKHEAAFVNLGCTFQEQGYLEQAEECYQRALGMSESREARKNLKLVQEQRARGLGWKPTDNGGPRGRVPSLPAFEKVTEEEEEEQEEQERKKESGDPASGVGEEVVEVLAVVSPHTPC